MIPTLEEDQLLVAQMVAKQDLPGLAKSEVGGDFAVAGGSKPELPD